MSLTVHILGFQTVTPSMSQLLLNPQQI